LFGIDGRITDDASEAHLGVIVPLSTPQYRL
jgi:hypothetical protein